MKYEPALHISFSENELDNIKVDHEEKRKMKELCWLKTQHSSNKFYHENITFQK